MLDYKLMPHQEKDLKFFKQNRKVLDLSDPSTGKTVPACLFLWHFWKTEKSKAVFICGTKSILDKNYEEILKFTPFTEEDVVVVDGPKEKREQLFSNLNYKVFLMGPDCFANNHESIPPFDTIVIDEVHIAYGNPNTKRSQALLSYKRKIKNFLAMSGTLVDGKLTAVYTPLKMVKLNAYPSFKAFEWIHCVKDEYDRVSYFVRHDLLKKALKDCSVRHTTKEVHGEGSKTIVEPRRKVEMSPEMRKEYLTLKESALVELEDRFLDCSNPGTELLRARQILSCPEALLERQVPCPKDDVLEEYALETDHPILVFAQFQAEQERIVKLLKGLGKRTALINQSVSQKKRSQIDKDFRAGKLDAVVGSPATMSVGFNWQHVDRVIFYSLGYKDSDFLQGIRRANRGTREYPLLVTVLEYKGTIEADIWRMLVKKSRDSKEVIGNTLVIKEGDLT